MAEREQGNGRAAVIALVGPEATGKSTIARELESWLASMYNVRAIHVGKPPATWLTFPVRILLPLAKRFFPKSRTSRLKGYVTSAQNSDISDVDEPQRNTICFSALVNAVWNVCIAWERCNLLVSSHKAANNHTFIVCDRYPSYQPGAMDSARLTLHVEQKGLKASLYNQLALIEHRIYQQIPAPDIVLQLSVSLETAKQRNRERVKEDKEGDRYIEARRLHTQSWQRMGNEVIYHIDTEQPFADTVNRVIDVIKKTVNGK
ncbi:hypothetical protein [Vibrio sp.]|uniref:hypothetical protein n=1 Tax=Vibrio sp. TaxID=678 RepID=UPI0029C80C4F|nr:hypothetical protein [uncultured Vibrio sp.]